VFYVEDICKLTIKIDMVFCKYSNLYLFAFLVASYNLQHIAKEENLKKKLKTLILTILQIKNETIIVVQFQENVLFNDC